MKWCEFLKTPVISAVAIDGIELRVLAKVTVSKVVNVEADCLDDAKDKVESDFMSGKLRFSSEDFDGCIETCQF